MFKTSLRDQVLLNLLLNVFVIGKLLWWWLWTAVMLVMLFAVTCLQFLGGRGMLFIALHCFFFCVCWQCSTHEHRTTSSLLPWLWRKKRLRMGLKKQGFEVHCQSSFDCTILIGRVTSIRHTYIVVWCPLGVVPAWCGARCSWLGLASASPIYVRYSRPSLCVWYVLIWSYQLHYPRGYIHAICTYWTQSQQSWKYR